MSTRYRTWEGVVVRRHPLPSGDLVVSFLTPEGPVDTLAKSAQRPGGRSGRIGLFHRVTFQTYERPGRELLTLTQVSFEEALAASEPFRFAAQGFLAELGWKTLSPEVAPRGYPVWVSGMRGIARAEDPRVPLVWAGFRLLAHAGYRPSGSGRYLSPLGELRAEPGEGAVFLGEVGEAALKAVLTRPGSEAIETLKEAPLDRLLEGLLRYAEAQLEGMRSARTLRALAS